MQLEFLNLSPDIWRVIFDIIRYVVVALILAYVTNVLVKRKIFAQILKAGCWNGGWKPIKAYIDG